MFRNFLRRHKALAEAEEGSKGRLRRHTVVAVGRRYLDALLREGAFLEAGQLCVRIFGVNKDLWQEEVFKFARLDILKVDITITYWSLKSCCLKVEAAEGRGPLLPRRRRPGQPPPGAAHLRDGALRAPQDRLGGLPQHRQGVEARALQVC